MGSSQSTPPPPTTFATQQWELVQRPEGLVKLSDLSLSSKMLTVDALVDGECIVECEMLSIDAFLRTMLDEKAYHGAINIGDTVPALGYGTVRASKNKKLKVGSRVMGMMGASSYSKLSKEAAAQTMPMLSLPGVAPQTFLGLLGVTSGLTAWVGIHAVTKPPRKGETCIVSGAAGATGSVAAQLARLNGARVIGIAGGERKAAYLKDTLGLDGAVDYKAPSASVAEQLDALCPDGIDFYFDTVGGEILDDVLRRIKRHGRVVVCGASSQYNGNLNVGVVRGPSEYLKLAERGAMMVGYNVMFYLHRLPGAMLHILWLVWRGKLFLTEQVEKGIDAFGPALIKMFTGGHIGKLLVDVKAQEQATPKAA